MRLNRNICGVAAVLSLLLILSASVYSQDLPAASGGRGSPLSMLDDLTSRLLAEDQVLTQGKDVASTLLEDLKSTDVLDGDPITTFEGSEPPPPPPPPPPPSETDPSVPVDGGLSLLLAAGAAYGAKRLRHRKRE
jgi:hypothetical protein